MVILDRKRWQAPVSGGEQSGGVYAADQKPCGDTDECGSYERYQLCFHVRVLLVLSGLPRPLGIGPTAEASRVGLTEVALYAINTEKVAVFRLPSIIR